jgi:uncharacterized protein YodC (DUF2158 family)
MAFNIGDVLKLKSGGPDMTIADGSDTTGFMCTWFEGTKVQRAVFPASTLELEPAHKPQITGGGPGGIV